MNCEEVNNHESIDPDSINNSDNDVHHELKRALDKAILKEMKEAENVVTKQTIHLRVYKTVANILNLDACIGSDSKSINIHPNNMIRIDEKWKRHLQKNFQLSHDEMNAYDKIKCTDYVKMPDIIKFISVLVRKDIVDRDPNDKEKILKSQDLNILLGVDGFAGYMPSDMKNYIENLKFGDEMHVGIVRKMYNLDIIKSLSGTDASCIVFLALMSIYKQFITDDQAKLIISSVETDIRTYLSKNAKYYKDINKTLENIEELIVFYTENVSEEEIGRICVPKVAELIAKAKKRKTTSTPGKRGRKKLKIATENDEDVLKKRKRTVKPLTTEESS